MKLVTLLFLLKDDQILLAMKKRRYGAGKWNGVGGKADPGETTEQAIIRESQEEIGITPINPALVGRITFLEEHDPTFGHDCYIFTAREWQGEPTESEEMRPQWFDTADIPYKDMWSDDKLWLPLLLQGKLFEGTITTDAAQKLRSHELNIVTSLTEQP